MKRVQIKSITMRNFRGEQERTTMFNQKGETFICGRNGLGKTRHFDAAIWLLFGKDTADRKDYEIKTRVNGEELHECETSVTGVFDVGGREITLKRAIIEDWVKPRGATERVFKGNRTECAWNGTPISVTEYTKRVNEIIDGTLFKMVTNPEFFVNMKWQDMREQLMQIAGDVTDEAIAEGRPEFAALLDMISGKSLDDYRKELNATRRKLKAELDDVQPRIDQTQRMMPELVDVKKIQSEIKRIDACIAEIDKSIGDVTAGVRKQYERAQDIQRQIGEYKMAQNQLLMDARAQEQEKATKANAGRRTVDVELKLLSNELTQAQSAVERTRAEWSRRRTDLDMAENNRRCLLEKWQTVHNEQYAGETICPHCKQELPQEMRNQAMEMFNTDKAERLNAISTDGKAIAERIEAYQQEIETLEAREREETERVEVLKKEVAHKKAVFESFSVVEPKEVQMSDISACVDLQSKIVALQETLDTSVPESNTDDLQAKKREYMAQRDALRNQLSNADARKRCEDEIVRLKQEGKELAQRVADVEKQEFTAESFISTKVSECERRINEMFTMVTFRMFDYTQDGNAFETCIPMVNGVPYGVANTASKINAGIDIINALVKHYGVSAPVFIDNAESINARIPCDSQIINLVVTTDDALVIK